MRDSVCSATGAPAPSVAKIPKVPTTNAHDAVCVASIRAVMEIFAGKWAFLVLEQLHAGAMRFGDLRRALGVSTKSLTDTLRHLEAKGIIRRTAYPTVPVTVEYSLTEKGRSFDEVLLAMKNWGRVHLWGEVGPNDYGRTAACPVSAGGRCGRMPATGVRKARAGGGDNRRACRRPDKRYGLLSVRHRQTMRSDVRRRRPAGCPTSERAPRASRLS